MFVCSCQIFDSLCYFNKINVQLTLLNRTNITWSYNALPPGSNMILLDKNSEVLYERSCSTKGAAHVYISFSFLLPFQYFYEYSLKDIRLAAASDAVAYLRHSYNSYMYSLVYCFYVSVFAVWISFVKIHIPSSLGNLYYIS